MLRASHGFDEGNKSGVDLLSESRHKFFERGGYPPEAVSQTLGKLYTSVASELSPHIQCADLAAGFAKKKYSEHGLCAVVEAFDYVTLNGERIDDRNYDASVSYWKALTDREERIKSLIVKE